VPLGVASNYRYYPPYPLFVREGHGSRITDVDGNQYIDHNLCYGALMAGHCHPAVMLAVEERLRIGTLFGMPHGMELELAEEKLREERGNAQAKAAADAALAKLKESPTKTMKDLFPAATDTEQAASAPDASAAPHVEETGLFSLRATREGIVVEGIGVSTPLGQAAFALTAEKPLAGPFDVNGTYVVARLKERKEPDLADFEKRKADLSREAELTKWEQVLADWMQARCVEAKQAKRININTDVLRYEDSSEPPPYEPCVPHRQFGG